MAEADALSEARADGGAGAPRVALLGCGRWGRHILRDLLSLGCEVPVVARSEESRRRAEDGSASAIVPDLASLGPVDGVVIATPTATHAEMVGEALELGVPVFVEKPLTADVASARRLAAAAPDRLFVMDKWRYHPGVRELARIARSGELGAPVGIHSRRVTLGHRYTDVNTVWIHAPHDLAIALEILGELPEPRAAVPELVGGELAGLTALLGDSPWLVVEVTTLAPGHRRELRLVCENGVAQLDGAEAGAVVVARAGAIDADSVERRPIADEMPLLAELRAFVEHLRGGPPPLSSAADGVAVVEVVAAMIALTGVEEAVAT
ncbi:MAG TPA: Gfo/Idh/MocA family oxidoreductase [Solirubrobacterales bacterium]|nr:Gfo/Idh/MocA family oxidoreductase [Solirubrobacterales bacterium]